jgi:hypothetical protein
VCESCCCCSLCGCSLWSRSWWRFRTAGASTKAKPAKTPTGSPRRRCCPGPGSRTLPPCGA